MEAQENDLSSEVAALADILKWSRTCRHGSTDLVAQLAEIRI